MSPAVVVEVAVTEILSDLSVVADCEGIAGGIPEAYVVWPTLTEIILVKAPVHKPSVVRVVVSRTKLSVTTKSLVIKYTRVEY